MMMQLTVLQERSCRGCTKCCEGWLEADIRGHKMSVGIPCFYLSKASLGCSEYALRPVEPCVKYRCAWLDDQSLPYELRPNVSNLLISKRCDYVLGSEGMNRLEYYEVVKTGEVDLTTMEALKAWAEKNEAKLEFFFE